MGVLAYLLQAILIVTPDDVARLYLVFTHARYIRQRFGLGFPLPTSHTVRHPGMDVSHDPYA